MGSFSCREHEGLGFILAVILQTVLVTNIGFNMVVIKDKKVIMLLLIHLVTPMAGFILLAHGQRYHGTLGTQLEALSMSRSRTF